MPGRSPSTSPPRSPWPQRSRRSSPSTAGSGPSSTTPGTASTARSRRRTSRGSARCSRPTSSASPGSRSSSCPACAAPAGAGSSTSVRWEGGSPSPSAATTTRRSTRWRPSATPCATRFAASASTSSSSSPASSAPASRRTCTPRWPTAPRHKMIRRMPRCWPATRRAPPRATATTSSQPAPRASPVSCWARWRRRSRAAATSSPPAARALIGARTFGGDRVWDAYIKRQFKV